MKNEITSLISEDLQSIEARSRDYALVWAVRQRIESGLDPDRDRLALPVDTTGRPIMTAVCFIQ